MARLGGGSPSRCPIINAFAADVARPRSATVAAAPDVRWVSLDGPVQQSSTDIGGSLVSAYPQACARPTRVWNDGLSATQGQNVTVAVLDSGVTYHGRSLRRWRQPRAGQRQVQQ